MTLKLFGLSSRVFLLMTSAVPAVSVLNKAALAQNVTNMPATIKKPLTQRQPLANPACISNFKRSPVIQQNRGIPQNIPIQQNRGIPQNIPIQQNRGIPQNTPRNIVGVQPIQDSLSNIRKRMETGKGVSLCELQGIDRNIRQIDRSLPMASW